ncbi:MAG: hypothetical protein ACK4NF_03845 [Planctomycetota bacterium]
MLKDLLLQYVKVKTFPHLNDFEALKNKYKKEIENFYSDLITNSIPYIRYIKEYNNALTTLTKMIKSDFKQFQHIVIIGIGGIVNGTKAIYYTLKDKIKKEIVFIDNTGFSQFEYLQNFLRFHLNPHEDILIFVSKSGETLETLMESSFFLNILPDFLKTKRILIETSEKNKLLDKFATTYDLPVYYLPSDLGGRFSHFYSSLLPLLLCETDVTTIFEGARRFIERVENNFYQSKFLYFVLDLHNTINTKNIASIIVLNYIDKLHFLSDFFVQLWDESLGKCNEKGMRFPVCMINALCPKEQHSQLQAFLEGKHDKIFFFVVPSIHFSSLEISDTFFYNRKFRVSEILNCQGKAVASSFIKESLPIRWFEIEQLNEEFVGEFLTFFTLLVIFTGYLNQLNPYNQNAVELYKNLTRSYLKLTDSCDGPAIFDNLTEF